MRAERADRPAFSGEVRAIHEGGGRALHGVHTSPPPDPVASALARRQLSDLAHRVEDGADRAGDRGVRSATPSAPTRTLSSSIATYWA
jgi:hypothetical protein